MKLSSAKKILFPILAVTVGLAVGLVAAEAVVRIFLPESLTLLRGEELPWFREGGQTIRQVYTLDPDFGFRPLLGNDVYNRFGTLVNDYRGEKQPGRRRVLFLGDSVTRRGKIIAGLKKLYGSEGIEYWNAGVESFNTPQEVLFYKRFNASLRPDQVVLTFHLNDFETTPVVFEDKFGALVVYTPQISTRGIGGWLFRRSGLYQLAVRYFYGQRGMWASKRAEIRDSLAELKKILDRDGVGLTVLILPKLVPFRDWTEFDKTCHDEIMAIARELGLNYVDLLPISERALADGLVVQETPGDFWHPSSALGLRFAEELKRIGLLDGSPGG